MESLLKELNQIRSNTKSYLEKIEYYEKFLNQNSNDGLFLEIESNKILINTYSSFEELKELIKNETITDLKPLKFNQNLVIKNLPSDPIILQNFDYMSSQFVIKKLGLSDQFKYWAFHSILGSRNAELSAFLQLLDDNNTIRPKRKNILSSKFSNVGISIGKICDNHYVCYLIFAG